MLGSAASGMLARIPTHPIDTCKARLQVQTTTARAAPLGWPPAGAGAGAAAAAAAAAARAGIPSLPAAAAVAAGAAPPYRHLLDALLRTARGEGLAGLYRGFPVAFFGSAPAACLYFSSYEAAKAALPAALPAFAAGPPAAAHLTAGLLAEAASGLLWVPIDVIKERMQVQVKAAAAAGVAGRGGSSGGSGGGWYYASTADAVRQIVAGEGLRGVYRGYAANLASFGPFSALYFAFYEHAKGWARAAEGGGSSGGGGGGSTQPLPLPQQMAVAAGAGSAAAFLTTPLDLVKLRLQVQRATLAAAAGTATPSAPSAAAAAGAGAAFHYGGMADGLRRVVAAEGWRALFRGGGARVAYHAPATALSMTLFERCRHAAEGMLRETRGAE
jgi:hypothetical protein